MTGLEEKVKRCYETVPFPDTLRKSRNFEKELIHIIGWIRLNLNFLSNDLISFSPQKILCAGCGTGEESIALARIFPNSKIEAVDIAEHSLKIAQQNIKRAKVKNIKLRQYSIIKDLPYLKRKYDFIYSVGVIHHLSNPHKGFKILADKLKAGGKMLIALYNSWGLFFYRCQIFLLNALGRENSARRMFWIKLLGLDKGKNEVGIYDSYINPQIKTFSIEEVASWAKDERLKIAGIVPPLDLHKLFKYAVLGQSYFYRRKKFSLLVLKLTKLFFGGGPRAKTDNQVNLSFWKTFFYQLIFLLLGKGECQYLFTRSKQS